MTAAMPSWPSQLGPSVAKPRFATTGGAGIVPADDRCDALLAIAAGAGDQQEARSASDGFAGGRPNGSAAATRGGDPHAPRLRVGLPEDGATTIDVTG